MEKNARSRSSTVVVKDCVLSVQVTDCLSDWLLLTWVASGRPGRPLVPPQSSRRSSCDRASAIASTSCRLPEASTLQSHHVPGAGDPLNAWTDPIWTDSIWTSPRPRRRRPIERLLDSGLSSRSSPILRFDSSAKSLPVLSSRMRGGLPAACSSTATTAQRKHSHYTG